MTRGVVVVASFDNNVFGLVDFTVDYRFKRRRASAIVTPEVGRNRNNGIVSLSNISITYDTSYGIIKI